MDARDRTRPENSPASRSGWSSCTVLVALMLLASPAVAGAQNPFAPLPSQQPPTVSTPPPSSPSTSGGGLSTSEQLGLLSAGVLLIVGIAFLIRRDARAHAPAGRTAGAGPRATAQPRAKRVERSRAKAKAARRQRKRTR